MAGQDGQQTGLRKARRAALSLVLPLLLPLAVVELAGRMLLPAVPPSGSIPRNPYRYRGWPEYVDGLAKDPAPGIGRCVLIGNCQGYGGEYRRSMIYAAALEKKLRAARAGGRTDWEVHNWSVDGATSLDTVLLAACLAERKADVVLALTNFADYRAEHVHEGLAFSRTDIPRLLTRAPVRRALPSAFLARHGRSEDILRFAAYDACAGLRFREYAWSWLDRRFPGLVHAAFAPRMTYLPWRIPKGPLVPAIARPPRPESEPDVTYNADSRRMLREYAATLARGSAPVRIMIVEPYTVPDDDRVRRLTADAEALCAEYGLGFRDFRNLLEADGFLTSAHLSRRGHVRLAEALETLICTALDGS
jgi:hypothetical protein